MRGREAAMQTTPRTVPLHTRISPLIVRCTPGLPVRRSPVLNDLLSTLAGIQHAASAWSHGSAGGFDPVGTVQFFLLLRRT